MKRAADQLASDIAYDDSLQQFMLWQLFRQDGEDDRQLQERFRRQLGRQDWDPLYDVQEACRVVLRVFAESCAANSIEYWLTGESARNALLFGDFAPTQKAFQVGLTAEAFGKLERIHWPDGFAMSPPAADPRLPEAPAPKPSQWPFFCHESAPQATVQLLALAPGESVPPLIRVACFDGEFLIPSDTAEQFDTGSKQLLWIPDRHENRSFSALNAHEVAALRALAKSGEA
ncbi:MAG: hypothetical protein LBR32_03435 [Propionibacteriaceae bacterium]|nr:hypothetical protein [Propionibacteriaceae bacterium]